MYFSSGSDSGLFHFKDPLSYPHVTLGDLARGRDAVWIERPVGRHPDVPPQPIFHDREQKPVLGNLAVDLPQPRYANFIVSRRNVRLAGYRAFLGEDQTYHFDESYPSAAERRKAVGHYNSSEQYLNELVGFTATTRDGVYGFDPKGRKTIRIAEPVICLSSNEPPNYGSFLFRILPKLAAVAKLDPTFKMLVPLYPPKLKEYLICAGIDEHLIIPQYLEVIYELEYAFIPSLRNRYAWLDRETMNLYSELREKFGASAADRRVYNRRVYISRMSIPKGPSGGSRIMLNEPEVRAALESRGFETVEPQLLSIEEQIQVFSSASLILSASGSALYNAVFCYPGTTYIDIESEPHWVRDHALLLGSCGLNYGIFEGKPGSYDFHIHHQPFTVDIDRLLARLDWLAEHVT